MGGAFLRKKSLLDQFKDDYKMVDPIKARRTERQWENPIVRHKREKGVQDWAKSFAGKRHYRKLMRFNAMRSEAYTEKTAWTYLEELGKLEGEESRMDAAEKVLKALGCKPGTEGRWYDKDGEEVDIIDVLDNTEWAFAQKVCGQLQESKQAKKSEGSYRVKIGWKNAYDQDCDLDLIVSAPDEDVAGERGIAYVDDHIPHPRNKCVVSVRPYVEDGKKSEDSLDDFDNRRRVSPSSKYITFSGLARGAVRDDVRRVLHKSGILDPQLGKPGDSVRFEFGVQNNPRSACKALAALLELGERNTWYIKYSDGDSEHNRITMYSPDIPNDMWYAGDVDKIVSYIMPVKSEAVDETLDFGNPSFKPREYEGEYILYTLYGLDSDGDELDDIITSPKKSTVIHTIKELLPDYRRIYNGMHVTAILYDKNDHMLDSEVVWSTDQDESKGANEAAGEPSDVKDIAAYIKSLDPQTAPMYDAFGNKTGTVSFPKWYSDTKKLLFPCKFYSDADMNKIIKQGDEFISKKFGESAYELTLEKVFSNAFHSNCYAVRIKPAVKEASGANETIEYEKGNKNSRGEDAPWVIRDHKGGKVLASFAKKADAEAHLERMQRYSKSESTTSDRAAAIKDAIADAARATGLANKIVLSATNMPKLFIDVYQGGIMGDGINWEVTGNLSVRRFDKQAVKRAWHVDSLEELEKSFEDEFQQLKDGKFEAKDESLRKALHESRVKKLEAFGRPYREDVILQILDQDNNTYSREDLEGKTVAELEEIYSELINLAAAAKYESAGDITSRDVQDLARDALDASGAEGFVLDIVHTLRNGINSFITAKDADDGKDTGIMWIVHVPEGDGELEVEQYAMGPDGNWPSKPENTYLVQDAEELEGFLTDEFKALQETLDVSKEN